MWEIFLDCSMRVRSFASRNSSGENSSFKTMATATASPNSSCGQAKTVHSFTSVTSPHTMSSISSGDNFSPPRLINSLKRPVRYTYPSASKCPLSPVRSQPPSTCAWNARSMWSRNSYPLVQQRPRTHTSPSIPLDGEFGSTTCSLPWASRILTSGPAGLPTESNLILLTVSNLILLTVSDSEGSLLTLACKRGCQGMGLLQMGTHSLIAYVGSTTHCNAVSMRRAIVGSSAAEQLRANRKQCSGRTPVRIQTFSACCMTGLCIDGTAEYHVHLNVLAWSKNCTASFHPGVHTTAPPEIMLTRRLTMIPCRWCRGMRFRQMSLESNCSVDRMHNAATQRFSCVSGTSFGLSVVPLVCSRRHTSLRDTRGISSHASDTGTACCRVYSPAVCTSGTSSTWGIPSSLATVAMALSCPCCVMTTSAGRLTSSNRASPSDVAILRGATVQRTDNVRKATAASGPFGSASTTRGCWGNCCPSRGRNRTKFPHAAPCRMNSLSCCRINGCLPSVENMHGWFGSLSGIKSSSVENDCAAASSLANCLKSVIFNNFKPKKAI
eukprot:m.779014 g.779014  ORF g.779014 m.779014 type:complete len:553 (-) comp23276_c1_seq5:265-1923(-)